ncbi:hypothetical protein D9613_005810 [Agrocybe pediades]|uniref:Uncharacterized protein n=1 Tax=Agrocybe pediades TaxID=84607 RepID=A0A8H4VPM8_9AGAR|nr:hypothetical protein D9613_005810 [Agrocybe pediades]KAF9561806.1 hypothetical protein CPC08DRAFT_707177 [Agrocybe pediades]
MQLTTLHPTFLCILSFIGFTLAAIPTIVSPANGTAIGPGQPFNFSYQSIADYGTSSFNYTVWLFTSPPRGFFPVDNYATGFYFGRFAEPNYPGNPNPPNPAPHQLIMPDFTKVGKGFSSGATAHNATFYLAVMEEYGTSAGSVGYRMSLVFNHILYNVSRSST